MKVSVAIAAQNEGPDLEVTVATMLGGRTPADEVVIVDDNSLEPIAPRFVGQPKVSVVRNNHRMGSGPSKHLAASRCGGDIVVVSDAHMRVGYDWLNLLLRDHHENPCAVLCPANRGFEHDGMFHGAGAKFVLEHEGFWKPSWLSPKPVPVAYTVPCIIGGLYVFPRMILDEIGGYAPGLVGYGCEEEWVSLRAWAAGFECRVSPRCIALHHYGHACDRRTADGALQQPWEMARNREFIRMSIFPTRGYDIPIAQQDQAAVRESLRGVRNWPMKRTESALCSLTGIEHPQGG